MSENLIYFSREEGKHKGDCLFNNTAAQKQIWHKNPWLLLTVNEFWVTVQRTEASERCGLTGSYWLKAENDALILKETKTKKRVLVWPYKLLRRYGRDRVGVNEITKLIFSFFNQDESQPQRKKRDTEERVLINCSQEVHIIFFLGVLRLHVVRVSSSQRKLSSGFGNF